MWWWGPPLENTNTRATRDWAFPSLWDRWAGWRHVSFWWPHVALWRHVAVVTTLGVVVTSRGVVVTTLGVVVTSRDGGDVTWRWWSHVALLWRHVALWWRHVALWWRHVTFWIYKTIKLSVLVAPFSMITVIGHWVFTLIVVTWETTWFQFQLESIVRISEALAKMRLTAFTTDNDVEESLRLFQVYYSSHEC